MAVISQDQFFTGVFTTGLSDPNSKAYLPGIILSSTSPSLNPYQIAAVNLGEQSFGNGISLNVSLSNLVISNLANITISPTLGGSLQLNGLNIALTAQMGQLNPPPPGTGTALSLTCNFTLESEVAGTLTGNFSVTISAAALSAAFVLSGSSFSDITLTFSSLNASVPSTVTVNPVVNFDGGGGGFWATLFENYLKEESTIQSITGQINTKINTPSLLQSLSAQISTIVQNNLKSQLGN